MKRLWAYALLLLTALILGSCLQDSGFDEKLLETLDSPSLVVKGKTVFRYDDRSCQESWSPVSRTYRAGTDTMSDWFEIQMSAVPSENEMDIEANLSWTGRDNQQSLSHQHFELRATDDRGLVWLWCKRQQITVVIRLID